ncbi:hypothetical protein DSECCO2_535550 [anaerobic digester metagenome]
MFVEPVVFYVDCSNLGAEGVKGAAEEVLLCLKGRGCATTSILFRNADPGNQIGRVVDDSQVGCVELFHQIRHTLDGADGVLFAYCLHPDDGIVFDSCLQKALDTSVEDIKHLGIGGTVVVGAVGCQRSCFCSDQGAAKKLCVLEVVFKPTQMLVPYRLVRVYWVDVATEDTDVGAVCSECFAD